ncbi:hypothetical protein RJ639_032657 [Escallonia herrerae]|uniref:DUF7866 domain-containing protein n=1 Tax=Escallonia herrerae TaxID=1293975 RepID=A0AA88WUE3_9ASTE|nr:hypothetical protein RJ639_032657 [Escallonia herrerae]
MSVTASGFLFSLFLLLLFGLSEVRFAHAFGSNGTAAAAEMVPLIEPGKAETVVMLNESRRRLGSFQICALCTCCGGAKGYCLPSPCCYAINCNIPNRPFGYFMNGYFQVGPTVTCGIANGRLIYNHDYTKNAITCKSAE